MQVPAILQGESLKRLLQGARRRCGRDDYCRLWLGRLVASQYRRQDGEGAVRRRGCGGAGASVRRQIPRVARRRGEDNGAFESGLVEARRRIPQGTGDPPGTIIPKFRPCVRLLHAAAYAEICRAPVTEPIGTLLRGYMTVNALPEYVMRAAFVSLAAAVVVFVGLLLLTIMHP